MNFIVIKWTLLIDGTGRSPIQNGAVRIKGDPISAVGPEREIGLRKERKWQKK